MISTPIPRDSGQVDRGLRELHFIGDPPFWGKITARKGAEMEGYGELERLRAELDDHRQNGHHWFRAFQAFAKHAKHQDGRLIVSIDIPVPANRVDSIVEALQA